jgi:hypothetical protein
MTAKSFLLTVPLAVSALLFLSLPAHAVCWSWKPCADYRGRWVRCSSHGVSILVAAFAAGGHPAYGVSDRTARCDGGASSGRAAGKTEAEEA